MIRTSRRVISLAFIVLLLGFEGHAQRSKPYLASNNLNLERRENERFRIVFYNVENLFDYFDDSTTIDEEFLPNQGRYWNKRRYADKQQKLSKTLIALGGWEAPELIGLCEIENRYVLTSLTQFTPLKNARYEIIHQDSRDRRGIDVAAIYRPDKFELINYEYYPLNFPFDPESRTRDILHVIGKLPNQDTLHYFVNHWPSKFGGEFETMPKRNYAAKFLRQKVDSILTISPNANIVLSGDFNDEPESEAMTTELGVELELDQVNSNNQLYNLMYPLRYLTGTHSFENKWSIIDQFVVTGNLIQSNSKTFILDRNPIIGDLDFLIMEGATGATRPFRTYQGPKYVGGFSDHLPILLDLVLKK